MPVVAVWSPSDLLTGVLAPLGLAMTRDRSLVIDLDPRGPNYGGSYSLAQLVERGPTLAELRAPRKGTAVIANGGVTISEASEVVAALINEWPNVVLRCDPAASAPDRAVPIVPLLPGPLAIPVGQHAVYQSVGLRVHPPPSAFVLPRPRQATIDALVGLRTVPTRSRWLSALSKVWALA
jgi:hypothetical protein